MPVIRCPGCRTELNVPPDLIGSQVQCGQCQLSFLASASEPPPLDAPGVFPPGPPDLPPGYAPLYPGPATGRTSGMAVASLVLGIISIPSCIVYGVPSLVCGILAVVFAGNADRQCLQGLVNPSSSGMAKAGRICGIIGIILSLLMIVCIVIGITAFSQARRLRQFP